MINNHPYVFRIRAEREVIKAINEHKKFFGNEIAGLSPTAIESWFSELSSELKDDPTIVRIKNLILSIGAFTKLSSNGSHRGAMIAPAPNKIIASKLISYLRECLQEIDYSQARPSLSRSRP